MRYVHNALVCLALILGAFSHTTVAHAQQTVADAPEEASPEAQGRLGKEVDDLVGQLLADSKDVRQAARERLLKLAGPGVARADRVLDLLPKVSDDMPPALKKQLNDLRVAIDKRIAESAVNATRVTLDVKDAPLAKVLAAIKLQTENVLQDNREQFGQEAADRLVTLKKTDAPFWEVMDELLDQTEMDIYAYSGEDALALVNRDQGRAPRTQHASYGGPFRVAAIAVNSTRDLRQRTGDGMNLQLEVSWEPRLRPIALTQKLQDVVVTNEKGQRLMLRQPEQDIDLELSSGNQATEFYLPMVLPERSTKKIATLRGTINVLAPGREVTFKFPKLKSGMQEIQKQRGGVSVKLMAVRKNNAIWEVHMRMKLEQAGEALASHRGWVFENKTYLLDKNGEKIDHAGFETTMQTQEEIGLAYLFDHEGGIEGLTWVYETPASVHRFPVEYELKDINLP